MSYSNIKELDNIIEEYKKDMEVATKFQKCMEEIRGINYKIIKISEIFEPLFGEEEVENTHIASTKIVDGVEITMFRDMNNDLKIIYNYNHIIKIKDNIRFLNWEEITNLQLLFKYPNINYDRISYEAINMRYNYFYY
jgi:hypothetical protein